MNFQFNFNVRGGTEPDPTVTVDLTPMTLLGIQFKERSFTVKNNAARPVKWTVEAKAEGSDKAAVRVRDTVMDIPAGGEATNILTIETSAPLGEDEVVSITVTGVGE